MLQIDTKPCQMDPLIQYLHNGSLPQDREEASKIQNRASKFILYEERFYKKKIFQPLLKCLRPSEASYALQEVHEGTCSNHLGAGLYPSKSWDKDIINPPWNKMRETQFKSVIGASATSYTTNASYSTHSLKCTMVFHSKGHGHIRTFFLPLEDVSFCLWWLIILPSW